jgi:hypothetical protein
MRAYRKAAATAVLLLVITAAFYWKLTLTRQYTWLDSPDMALQVLPWLEFQAREVHAGRLPFWDPYLWGGQSLIGQLQPGTAFPLNWVLFALPLRDDGHLRMGYLHWYWVAIHWIGALFAYWLCRDVGCGRAASVLGASVFALSGFMGQTEWPQILASELWTPLVLLYLLRVLRGQAPVASAALAGAAMGVAFLSGHHQVPVFTALAAGAIWVYHIISYKSRRRALGCAIVFAMVCALVSAFQVLPAVEYGRTAVRWAGASEPLGWKQPVPYSVHAEYSLHARGVMNFFVPGLMLHVNAFIGIVAFTLAMVGVAARWHSREVRVLATVSLGALAFALGADTFFHGAFYALVPGMEKARNPSTAIAVSHGAMAALAALGLEAWPGFRGARAVRVILIAFGAAVFGIYLALAVSRVTPFDERPAVTALAAMLLAGVLYGWEHGGLSGRAAMACAALLVLLEAGTVSGFGLAKLNRPGSYLTKMRQQADIAGFLRSQPGWFRVEADADEVPYNFGDYFGIEQFGGYLPSVPAAILPFIGQDEGRRLFGVAYQIARSPSRETQQVAFESASGLKVFRDSRFGTPLWTEHDEPCADEDQLRIVSRTSDSFVIDAGMQCSGRLVAGDVFFTGWQAIVDGERTPVQRVHGALRAVAVSAGRHRIEFRYRPGSVYWGAGLSACGLALAATLARLGR